MTTKETKNPYHDVLVAIALGKMIQFREYVHQDWHGEDNYTVLVEVAQGTYDPSCYRAKPAGIEANGFLIPRPLQVPPTYNSVYWYITANSARGYSSDTWTDHTTDRHRLDNRQLWASEADIKLAVEAMKSLLST